MKIYSKKISRGGLETKKIRWLLSFREAHYLAAANIDKLYSNAIEPWEFELNPNKDNTGLKARRYLYAPMDFYGKMMVVKITVNAAVYGALDAFWHRRPYI